MREHQWRTSQSKGENFSILGTDMPKAVAVGVAELDKVLGAKDRRPEFRSSATM